MLFGFRVVGEGCAKRSPDQSRPELRTRKLADDPRRRLRIHLAQCRDHLMRWPALVDQIEHRMVDATVAIVPSNGGS
jgi:hypothetical protein